MNFHYETHLNLQSNSDIYMWNQVNYNQSHYANIGTSAPYNHCSYPKVPCPHHHLMGTGIPIFRQVLVTIVVAENDTPIRLQIERSNPAILAPQLLWLSTESRTRLTSPRRLIPTYAMKNTRKNTTKLQMKDYLTKLGSHKPMNGETVLDRII